MTESEVERMNDDERAVARALARYAKVRFSDALPALQLSGELRLEPLNVVHFALSFERRHDHPFPISDLIDVRTAGDLIGVVYRYMKRRSATRNA